MTKFNMLLVSCKTKSNLMHAYSGMAHFSTDLVRIFRKSVVARVYICTVTMYELCQMQFKSYMVKTSQERNMHHSALVSIRNRTLNE